MALSFAFGGSSGQSYEELRRKRAFAEALQLRGAQGQPKSAIEGINSATQSILGALMSKKFGQQEEAGRAASQEHMTNVLGSLLGGGGGTGGYSPVAAPVDPNSPATIGADAMAALGKPTNQPEGLGAFNAALSARESGGNYGVVNSEGYGGKYQFGDERLKDYSNATGENITMQQFLANPALQERVQAWHVGDIDKRLGSYVGTEVNGKPMTRDGIRAMAHLGGVGGARQFIESGGKYNPADSNGTTLANYAGIQGNGLASPEIAIPQLIGLLNDPYASEADKSVLGMLLQQQFAQMQPPDPMDALAQEKAQLEIDAMRNGTGAATEYGLQPIVTQDADGNYHLFQIPKDGSAPKEIELPYGWTPKQQYLDTGTGFQAMPTQGAAAGEPVVIPKDVAGERAAIAVGDTAGAAQAALPGVSQAAADVAAQVEALKSDPYLPKMLGPIDSRLPNVSPDAARVQGRMDQLQGGAFLQARQLLKGGGAITDYEGRKAEAAFARLSAAQRPEDYKDALDEFNYYVQQGVKKLVEQSGMAGSPPPAAQPTGTAQFRFNPATGKIEPVQ